MKREKHISWRADTPNHDIDEHEQIQLKQVKEELRPLGPGEVLIETHFSSMNYKDALALTGKGKILRKLPLTPGIDVSGLVLESQNPSLPTGSPVLVTGCGLGERFDGGYSSHVFAPEEAVIPLPDGLNLESAMILGTAGFTAGLAYKQLTRMGLTPEQGPIAVTGARGGVGSLAILLFKSLDYEVHAFSRAQEDDPWLSSLGVDKVISFEPSSLKTKKGLSKSIYAAAIDNLGGPLLTHLLSCTQPHGSVASIGLAHSAKLEATVFPFILRGVNLLGISSTSCPRPLREEIWSLLSQGEAPWATARTHQVELSEIMTTANSFVSGQQQGRCLVKTR